MSENSVSMSASSLSLKNQTKEKFESLLKNSQERSLSKEKLLNNYEPVSRDFVKPFKEKKEESLELKRYYNENYILNKFLKHQSSKDKVFTKDGETDTTVDSPMRPIPKPRKKFSSPQRQNTITVTSPKIVKQWSPKKNIEDSPLSNKTYNIEEIGDVLIHNQGPSPTSAVTKQDTNEDAQDDADLNSIEECESRPGSIEATELEKNEIEETENVPNKYSYQKITEIIIHKTDNLKLNSFLLHPVIKIHVVDASTGKYFPKSDKNRPIVFFYENNTNYILPVMTHAYDLQQKRVQYPAWEEIILFNEDYEYIKEHSSNIMFFFELLDFLSFSDLNETKSGYNEGWHNVAFAFLKLASKNNTLNIGKKVRLQLYHSCKLKEKNSQVCNPWTWWKKKKLSKYPSSLYVTIKSAVSPTTVVETFRSKTPMQRESSTRTKLYDDEIDNTLIASISENVISEKKNEKLNNETGRCKRKIGEKCKLPNKCLTQFHSNGSGCFVMKFSHNGNYLACAIQIGSIFSVVLYSVSTLKLVEKCSSHQALIYCIQWSKDDALLLSASADNTVAVFNFALSSSTQILPHPSFVYTCNITNDSTIVASGCYDGVVRIWSKQKDEMDTLYSLIQELDGHKNYVTCLCFSKKNNLFSADAGGIIIEWLYTDSSWILHRQIIFMDVNKEVVINTIRLFSRERKLLVHSRDNLIRILDKKTGCILQWLRGAENERYQLYCTISPCENFVYSGSENGGLYVWNSKNGHQIAFYHVWNEKNLPVHCVEHHPHDNILALSHYGSNVNVLVYSFDSKLQGFDLNVRVAEEYDARCLIEKDNFIKKNYLEKSQPKYSEKLDFKSLLKKMDLVVTSPKQ